MNYKKIGVFDSGVGGLFILQKLAPLFPQIHWIYFADTKNWPYGNKSKEQLTSCFSNVLQFLDSLSVEGILIACNTASSLFMDETYYKNKIPLINIIKPALTQIIEFIKKENKKRIGVLGTQRTVQSNVYKDHLLKLDSNVEVFQLYISKLTALIENNEYEDSRFEYTLKDLVQWIQDQKLDALILGCTHYLVLKERLQKYLPILDPLTKLTQNFEEVFEIEKQENNQQPLITLYSNKESNSVKEQAQKIMNSVQINLV